MDSGNSGSMQSSSGGEEEYDSRGESIPSFLNSSAHFGSIPESQSRLLSHQPTDFFNPHSHNLDAFNPQSLGLNPSGSSQFGNNDLVWSRGLRSQSNYGNFGNLPSLSSSAQSVLGSSTQGQGLNTHHQAPLQSNIDANNSSRVSQQSDPQPNTVKNPKKRTRASRRAPTTVLTTDTTNFRQMVQEFTGIPTSPFSGSPNSYRRLDLFSGGSGIRSGHLDGLGSLYPLRPSAQKVQLNPFFPPSTSLLNSGVMDSLVPTTTTTTTTTTGTNNTNNNPAGGSSSVISNHDYQITSNLGLNPKQPQQNILNMQNQTLAFQHFLLKNPTSILSTKSQGSTSIPTFDDLGLSHDQNVNASLGGVLSQGIRSAGTGEHQEQPNSRNYNKFNCLASTSEFHPDKGLENVTSTGEGAVGSWICPSD